MLETDDSIESLKSEVTSKSDYIMQLESKLVRQDTF